MPVKLFLLGLAPVYLELNISFLGLGSAGNTPIPFSVPSSGATAVFSSTPLEVSMTLERERARQR